MWRRPPWQRFFIIAASHLLPARLLIVFNFLKRVGYWPSLSRPRSYNEKIQYRKLHDRNPLYATCSDKLAVRQYVTDRIGADYLVPLLYSGTAINESTLKALAGPLVVKATHDSGTVLFVRDEETADYRHIVERIAFSLGLDYGRLNQEPWYSAIEPRVIIEPLLSNQDGSEVRDYKLHVFRQSHGHKIILQVDYDRQTRHTQTFYDDDFNVLPISLRYPNEYRPLAPIPNVDDMIRIARLLAEDFDYVRVDLYNVDGRIYFGEMTFAHESGFGRFTEKSADFEMGELWQLDITRGPV